MSIHIRNKYLIILILLTLVGVGVYFISANMTRQAPSSPVLKVGAILPFTGDFAHIAKEMQRGMDLALREGQNSERITIIYEDNLLDTTTATIALHKLIDNDKVGMVFNWAMPDMKALAPIFNEQTISLWDSNASIQSLGDYAFSIGYSNEQAGNDMADFAFRTLGARRYSVISAHDDWSEIVSGAFIKQLQTLGGKIVLREKVNLDENDFKTILLKMKQTNSDVVYFPLYLSSLTNLIQQAREIGYTGALLTPDGFTENDLRNLGKLVEGIYTTQPLLDHEEILKKYRSAYGSVTSPSSLAFVGLGYDAIQLVSSVLGELEKESMPINGENVRQKLVGHPFKSSSGTVSITSERMTNRTQRTFIIRNSVFSPID